MGTKQSELVSIYMLAMCPGGPAITQALVSSCWVVAWSQVSCGLWQANSWVFRAAQSSNYLPTA